MSEEMDERPAEPMAPEKAFFFEGSPVHNIEGKLPAITLEMPEGYARGTHLKMMVEVRVRNVRYEEDRKGDLTRQHVFALEEVTLVGAFSPEELDPGVGGSASGAAVRAEDAEPEVLDVEVVEGAPAIPEHLPEAWYDSDMSGARDVGF